MRKNFLTIFAVLTVLSFAAWANTTTTNFSFNKPAVNDPVDEDLWGTYLNDNFDLLDGTILPVPAASKYGALVVQKTSDNGYEILSGQGTSGQFLKSNGADALPSFASLTAASDTTAGVVELATITETGTGTDATRAVTPDGLQGAIGFSKMFTSTGQTITAGGSLTLAHSLPTTPVLFSVSIKCTTADGDYEVGDEVFIGFKDFAENANAVTGIAIQADGTNITVRFGSRTQTFVIPDEADGTLHNITNANWQLYVRAWG